MPLISRSLVSASFLGLLAVGACTGDDSLGRQATGGQAGWQASGGQAAGQAGGQAGTSGQAGTGGQAGAGGQSPAGSNGCTRVAVTTQETALTGTSSTVTYFNLDLSFTGDVSNQTQAVTIATDGAAWFTGAGMLLRAAADDSVCAWPDPAPGGYAGSLVSDGTGALWVAFWGPPPSVALVDPVTLQATTLPLPDSLARPTALATNGLGGVWVSGGNEPAVARVDLQNGPALVASESAPSPITVSTAGLAVASDGQVFVSDYDQGRIGRIVGGAFVWISLGTNTLSAPSGLAADTDGSVWFVSLGVPNEVGRVTHDGDFYLYALPASPTPTSGKSASTIARAPDGSFWFALPERHQLGRITAGGQVSTYQLADGTLPVAVAFDASGRLWFTAATGFGRVTF
jgi:streptogramin lyase